MKLSEMFEKAGKLLTEKTWGKGDGSISGDRTPAGSMCILDAMRKAGNRENLDIMDSLNLINKVINDKFDEPLAFRFNDKPDTVLQDVHIALHEAAIRARNEGN